MKELEKVNLIRCKQCGMLYGEEIKHKCDNIRKAAYRQGKADGVDEYKTALITAFNETNINEYGFYPQNIVDMVAEQVKEKK